jgi:O-antigen ligase
MVGRNPVSRAFPAPLVPIVAPVPAARQLAVSLRTALIRYPILPLTAVVGITFVWFAASNGGYDGTTWYPGTLIVLALFAMAVIALPVAGLPRLLGIATAALFAYAAWSYLSIGWADQKGDAWDGANRSLLYALVFALFALWRPRGRIAVGLLIAYSVSVSAVGLIELLRASGAAHPTDFFIEGRFASPAGYMNANVALWSSALWPCIALGSRRELKPALRGLLVGLGVFLCGLAVLGQSRGWLFTAPVAALAFVALVPQRVRTVLTLALVLAGTGVVVPTLLDVYSSGETPSFGAALSDATSALVLAAIFTGVVGGLLAMGDRRARPSRTRDKRAGQVLAATAVAAVALGLIVFVAAKGSPFTAASDAWHEFKTQPSPSGSGSRFTATLGTNRFDFWRVAWDQFTDAPLVGKGADNYQQAYLLGRHSLETPRYPHSVELRTISQTGLIGAALLLTGVGAAFWAALLAIRRRTGLGSAAAAAATASFVYWVVHGSVDWFWEFPALGAPAFALLGLAAGLLPRAARPPEPRRPRRQRSIPARVVATPALVLGLALIPALSLAGPWLAEVQQKHAASNWQADPSGAFDTLDSAASLNPLSATPKLLAGSIAQRLGRGSLAERYFREALERDPRDAYAHLELGGLLAQAGRRPEAIVILTAGRRLDPRDDLTATVLRRVRAGKKVNLAAVNRQLAERSARLGR